MNAKRISKCIRSLIWFRGCAAWVGVAGVALCIVFAIAVVIVYGFIGLPGQIRLTQINRSMDTVSWHYNNVIPVDANHPDYVLFMKINTDQTSLNEKVVEVVGDLKAQKKVIKGSDKYLAALDKRAKKTYALRKARNYSIWLFPLGLVAYVIAGVVNRRIYRYVSRYDYQDYGVCEVLDILSAFCDERIVDDNPNFTDSLSSRLIRLLPCMDIEIFFREFYCQKFHFRAMARLKFDSLSRGDLGRLSGQDCKYVDIRNRAERKLNPPEGD